MYIFIIFSLDLPFFEEIAKIMSSVKRLGEVPERFNGTVLKTVIDESRSRVQIPASPHIKIALKQGYF